MDRRTTDLSEQELNELIAKTVKQTLIQIGIDATEPFEMQKDFQHLRDWRESTESIKHKSLITMIGIIVAGSIGLMIAGFKSKYFP